MNLKELRGVGPKTLGRLEKIGIRTLEDLLYYMPSRYINRSAILDLAKVGGKATGSLAGTVVGIKVRRSFNTREILVLSLQAQGYTGEILFFNGQYLKNNFKFHKDYYFYGEVKVQGRGFKMIQPEFASVGDQEFLSIVPVYPVTAGISQKNMRSYMKQALNFVPGENLPQSLLGKNRLCSRAHALENMHFPTDRLQYKEGKYRLIYEEFFLFILGNRLLKGENGRVAGHVIPKNSRALEDLQKQVGFEPTPDQLVALEEILEDLAGPRGMRRLLQGDVGSGKTFVALFAAYNTALSGFQAGVLAPTEILATQLFREFKKIIPDSVSIVLLTGSTRDKERVYSLLASGEIQILVGTHAIIQSQVAFKNLGLLVVDEQHRFGVNQRQVLIGQDSQTNYLMMSATPIPRTLSMILYSDVEVSTIRSMPKGRRKIETQLVLSHKEPQLLERIKGLIDLGYQGYVVFPLIEASEHFDEVDSLFEGFKRLQGAFSDTPLAMIHGKMPGDEKNRVIDDFKSGQIKILVSTTVIEVGIDHPRANFIVIYNAERFGLSQLHQLRGRVGRSDMAGYCFLVSRKPNDNLTILTETTDGFKIALADLKKRGPGEVLGLRQHGSGHFLVADLLKHTPVMHRAMADVTHILENSQAFETYLEAMKEKILISKG